MADEADPRLRELIASGLRVERLLGRGRFARVYAAVDGMGEGVAVKVLTLLDRQGRLRFEREVEAMRQLPPHPNRVALRGNGAMPDGTPWIAMDLVDGPTLKSVMTRQGQVPESTAIPLLIQLCDGFDGFHTLGLAHRDVNPGNVLLTRDGAVKIIDYGLVQDAQGILKLYEQEHIVVSAAFAEDIDAGMIAGTLEYMAPEQFTDAMRRGERRTDTMADVFALGVILVELLTGTQRFGKVPRAGDAKARRDYINTRLTLGPDDDSARDRIGAELWTIVRKAMHPDPRKRQRDAKELARDLRFYLLTGRGVYDDLQSETEARPSPVMATRMITARDDQPVPTTAVLPAPTDAPGPTTRLITAHVEEPGPMTGVLQAPVDTPGPTTAVLRAPVDTPALKTRTIAAHSDGPVPQPAVRATSGLMRRRPTGPERAGAGLKRRQPTGRAPAASGSQRRRPAPAPPAPRAAASRWRTGAWILAALVCMGVGALIVLALLGQ